MSESEEEPRVKPMVIQDVEPWPMFFTKWFEDLIQ